jgi:hypothetical protein
MSSPKLKSKSPVFKGGVNKISKPTGLKSPSSTSSSLKIGSPEIRVGLSSVSKPKSSMIKMVGTKKNPTLTNEASMPKNKKVIVAKRKRA